MISVIRKKKAAGHLNTGRYGEELAAQFLTKRGYTILQLNYRKRFGEIDIIAREGEVLVFVEVKTRKSQKFGNGFDAVSQLKQRQLARVASEYIQRHDVGDSSARFDVVSILLEKGRQPKIDLIQNAFEVVE